MLDEEKDENHENLDISDDDLLNENLEEDDLLAEFESILGKQPEKPKEKKQTKKTKAKTFPKKINSKKTIPKKSTIKKAKIDGETMKEFSIFLLNKAKIYEEIAFKTIIRKIPKEWHFKEEILIDVLETMIENNAIHSIKMKMTASSLKFYPQSQKE
ncbi:MAG: hypothetical protein ACTSVU_02395 [Promethearchaeota archaeon]